MHAPAPTATLPHYTESHAAPYALFSDFASLSQIQRNFLIKEAGYAPEFPYPTHQFLDQYSKLSVDLYRLLVQTEYTLMQRSAGRRQFSPSSTHPVLGLSFAPIASSKRECVLGQEQLEIVEKWMQRYDALVWLENVLVRQHHVVFTQHQQQQRDLRLSRTLHDVNRWLVEWDNQGRGKGPRPLPAKPPRRLTSDSLEEERGAKRQKGLQGCVVGRGHH